MKKEVILYEFGEDKVQVRTILDDKNEPWFAAKDVLSVLHLQRNSLYKVSDKHKVVKALSSLGERHGMKRWHVLSRFVRGRIG